MHEMGHVLYYAGEHRGTTWNCSSIMGHCNAPRITAVQSHDIEDYKSALRVGAVGTGIPTPEGPNAAYITVSSTSDTTHKFEGGYLGGNGYTTHQERDYWIDRSPNGVNGSYSTYVGLPRVISNGEDGTPNIWDDPATYPVPWPDAEWGFKTRGRSGGVASSDPYYWGPYSKAYCISTAFSSRPGTCTTYSVVTTTDRNGDVYFRVYNFSGSTITNVTITNTSNTTLCTIGSISSGHSDDCHKSRSGSGTVKVWWNGTWGYCDTIEYGS